MKDSKALLSQFTERAFQLSSGEEDAITAADAFAGLAHHFPGANTRLRGKQNFHFACGPACTLEHPSDACGNHTRIIKNEYIGRLEKLRKLAEIGIVPVSGVAIED